jgi:hypothetical protein
VTAIDERAPAGESDLRPCAYCGEPFDPKGNAAKLYCTREHQKYAAAARRRDRARSPERTPVCPWCGVGFTTRLAEQVFCVSVHRKRATSCDRRRGFLTQAAAKAAAAETIGSVEPYRCPRATGEAHWHLGVPS